MAKILWWVINQIFKVYFYSSKTIARAIAAIKIKLTHRVLGFSPKQIKPELLISSPLSLLYNTQFNLLGFYAKLNLQLKGSYDPLYYNLGKKLRNNKSLTALSVHFNGNKSSNEMLFKAIYLNFQYNHNLSKISLYNAALTTKQFAQLAEFLWDKQNLEYLSISDEAVNLVEAEAAIALAEGLRCNQSLKKLSIKSNMLCEPDISLEINSAIDNQNLSYLINSALKNPNLQELSLVNMSLAGFKIDWPNYLNNHYLEKLDLSANKMTDAEVKLLARALVDCQVNLNTLILDDNELSNESAKYFGCVLKYNTSLKHLSLYNNNLSNQGARSLQKGLISNNEMLSLNLYSMKISDAKLCEIQAKILLNQQNHLPMPALIL